VAKELQIVSHSEEQTSALATRLAESFKPGDVLILTGPLGAGKSVFVRGMAGGLGIDQNLVTSPTFTFVNEYPADKPLYHFDLYRLKSSSELYEIGWDEYLSRRGIVVVEWGEKAEQMLPSRYYWIKFGIIDEHQRSIDISLVEK
jgi:tRNA threonylcarbamoyladenosine biosynthesis protein TsaE